MFGHRDKHIQTGQLGEGASLAEQNRASERSDTEVGFASH